MSSRNRNSALVAQGRVQQLSSQVSYNLEGGSSSSSSSSKQSSTPEWTNDAHTRSEDVNKKVWSQQIHGPGSHKENMKPGAQSDSSSGSPAKSGQDVTTTHPSVMDSDASQGGQGNEGGGSGGQGSEKQGDTDTSNGKPRGPSGKELPGKGLGNKGMGPERYAREEDDSLPAKDTGTPTKDTEKKSDE